MLLLLFWLHARVQVDNIQAIGMAEGWIEVKTKEEYLAAWQHLIDTELAWSLQGWFGRQAQHYIDEGLCRSRTDETSS